MNRGVWMETQATARNTLHGGVAGGRSHGVRKCNITLGTAGGDDVEGGEAHRTDLEMIGWRETEDLGGHDRAAVTTTRGGSGDLESRGGDGPIEGRGRA